MGRQVDRTRVGTDPGTGDGGMGRVGSETWVDPPSLVRRFVTSLSAPRRSEIKIEVARDIYVVTSGLCQL